MCYQEGQSEGKTFLKSLLDRQMHFTVTDGRVFKGTFVCTDNDGSAILSETYEYRGSKQLHYPLFV